ncbi:MAG: transposase [Gammaproteobacteria bacterium]|nr:transposase [Gammaproteobacteria bacterium]
MRKVKLIPGHYYHVYNRGVNRGKIFFQRANWIFFLKRLRHYCQPESADILAYCQMPTHYHLLIYNKSEQFGKKVMQPFTVSYTKAVNKQQDRVGPLFQGPFQAICVDNDAYLHHLTRYIHLNPVMAGHVAHPADWEFSSYPDYIGMRNGTLPTTQWILNQFPGRQAYRDFVEAPARNFSTIQHLLP